MRKLILLSVLVFGAITINGQILSKGNTLGFHVFTLTLNTGVTMDQYLDFFNTKWVPAYEENFQGVKVNIVKGIKGECLNCTGMILAWKTKADMERYWKLEGGPTELTNVANDKLKTLHDELLKLGRITEDKYTDWEMQ